MTVLLLETAELRSCLPLSNSLLDGALLVISLRLKRRRRTSTSIVIRVSKLYPSLFNNTVNISCYNNRVEANAMSYILTNTDFDDALHTRLVILSS